MPMRHLLPIGLDYRAGIQISSSEYFGLATPTYGQIVGPHNAVSTGFF